MSRSARGRPSLPRPLHGVNEIRSTFLDYFHTNGHTVVGTVRLPGAGTQEMKPKGMALSPDARRLYVATGRGNSVAVLDTGGMKLLTLIPVGQRPWGIAITPDGKRLYAANGLSNDVSVVDTDTNQVVATVKAGDGPWGVVIKP